MVISDLKIISETLFTDVGVAPNCNSIFESLSLKRLGRRGVYQAKLAITTLNIEPTVFISRNLNKKKHALVSLFHLFVCIKLLN